LPFSFFLARCLFAGSAEGACARGFESIAGCRSGWNFGISIHNLQGMVFINSFDFYLSSIASTF